MQRFASLTRLSVILGILPVLGCSAEAPVTPSEEIPSEPSGANVEAIAEVALSKTHRIAFYEPSPGVVLVSEVGEIGVDLDTSVPDYEKTAELYQKLAGDKVDAQALARLRAADARGAALEAVEGTVDPAAGGGSPITTSGDSVKKHADFLNGSQCQANSFEGGYCLGPKWNQITSSDTGWQYCTKKFRSTVFNHQYTSTTSSAIHKVFYWGTKGSFWDEVASTWVTRGTWQSWFSDWKYVKATTGRATGQVTPGNHDQCVLDRALNSGNIDGTCNTGVLLCKIQ